MQGRVRIYCGFDVTFSSVAAFMFTVSTECSKEGIKRPLIATTGGLLSNDLFQSCSFCDFEWTGINVVLLGEFEYESDIVNDGDAEAKFASSSYICGVI